MKFTNSRSRHPPTIIIISLIDILIVLLIFLVVTTTFKQQPALKLVLPESNQAKTGFVDEKRNLLLTVARQEPFFYLGQKAVTVDRLKQELVAAARDPLVSVSIQPDTGATVGQFMKAWDAVAAAGIRNVRVVAKKPETGS
jgi:biopolymer transport protein ExbD